MRRFTVRYVRLNGVDDADHCVARDARILYARESAGATVNMSEWQTPHACTVMRT